MLFQSVGTILGIPATICAILLFDHPALDSHDNSALVSFERVNDKNDVARLNACDTNSNCVSSNYREPPNRYISSFKIVNQPEVAFQRAVRDLKLQNSEGISIVDIVPSANYIHLTVPGTAPSSLDDIDLVFTNDNIVNVRCQARVTLPPPPFCIRKNCINGNMDQRSRIEKLGYVLGLPSADRDEMQGAKWTPIFLNSDRVPGFDDEL